MLFLAICLLAFLPRRDLVFECQALYKTMSAPRAGTVQARAGPVQAPCRHRAGTVQARAGTCKKRAGQPDGYCILIGNYRTGGVQAFRPSDLL